MRESFRLLVGLPAGRAPPRSLVATIVATGGVVVADVVLYPRNVTLLFVIPLLVGALSSPPWIVAMVAALAILDDARHLGPAQLPPDAACATVAIVAVGSLGILLARQRDRTASSWRSVRREVAEREHAFALLQESEERFRLLADFTPALVWMSGPDKGCTYFNRAWLEFTGRTLEQERGTGWLEGVHPADAPGCLADYVAAFDSRREFSLEYRLRHRDGTFRRVLDRGAPCFTADGQLAGYVGAAMDVTALKHAEQAHRQLAAIVEASDDAIYSTALDGTILSWNGGAERIFGYAADEIVGRSILLLHPTDENHGSERIVADIRGGPVDQFRIMSPAEVALRISRDERVDHFRTMLRHKDGTRLRVSLTISPLHGPDGRIIGTAAIARDLSVLLEAYESMERQVVERTRELTTLLAASEAITSILDLRALLGLILDQLKLVVDCTATRLFSRAADELVLEEYRGPVPRGEIFPFSVSLRSPEVREALVDRAQPVVLADVSDGSAAAEMFQRTFARTTPARSRIARAWMWIPLKVNGAVVGGLSLSDAAPGYFTPRHQALAEAFANQAATALENARLYEQAQRLAILRERERLARDLHDAVTQTLFSMSLIADVLPRLWERQPEEGRRRLDELRQLTRGALLEMRTLLLELRPEGPSEVPLGDLLRQLADTMAALAQVPVSFVAVGKLPPIPTTVHVALYRIAHEALNNAARHARATRMTMRLRAGPDEVEVVIADDGRGFETASVPVGCLGIEIIRERAASIGATVAIESQVGRGTRIAVVWPVPADEDRQ